MKPGSRPTSSDVFVSSLLARRHPALMAALTNVFEPRLQAVAGTQDIWCRDYLPVPIAPGRAVRFRYRPDYLRGCPRLRTATIPRGLPLTRCRQSSLVIDGGNVQRLGNIAIVTDKIYRENPRMGRDALRRQLRQDLEVERLFVIPAESGDVLGHADGVLQFVDERTVLVNDYRKVDPGYGRRLGQVLKRHGIERVPCPYAPTDDIGSDGIPSAAGVYVNFLLTHDVLVCPIFGRSEDDRALRILQRCFLTHRIVSLGCEALAAEGGGLHCVTWNIQPEVR